MFGSYVKGALKKVSIQSAFALSAKRLGCLPAVIVISENTVICSSLSSFFFTYSGKRSTNFVSSVRSPSLTAKPIAVDVKLLLAEYIICLLSFVKGSLYHSAATFPWRITMNEWNSIECSLASAIKSITAFDDTPTSSGVLALGMLTFEAVAFAIVISLRKYIFKRIIICQFPCNSVQVSLRIPSFSGAKDG